MECNYVRDVDPGIIYKIQLLLTVDDNWKKLLKISSIDRQEFNKYVENHKITEDIFLARTVLDFCTDFYIKQFICWLEKISLEEALLMLKKDEPLKIIEEPKKVIEKIISDQNEEIVLSCKASGFPTPKYQWYRGDIPLTQDPILKIPVELKNIGFYYCEVYNISRSGIKTFLRTSGTVVIIYTSHIKNRPSFNLGPTLSQDDDCEKWEGELQWTNKCPQKQKYDNNDILYFAKDKFALLIGNSHYEYFKEVAQTTEDVCTVSNLLHSIGFKTFSFQNLNRKEIIEAVNLFCTFLRPGVYSLVYFAGHGFEQFKQCYLLPKEAKNTIPKENISVDFITKCLQKCNTAMNVILLDICRIFPNEYLEGKLIPGRTFVPQPSRNTVIAYSTSSSYCSYEVKNKNSVYVHYLKKHIKEQIPIFEMLLNVHRDIEKNPSISSLQYPNIFIDLTQPLKLTDEINGHGERFQVDSERWKLLTSSPGDLCFKCENFNIILKFTNYQGFCNVLLALLYVQVPKHKNLSLDDYEGILEFPHMESRIREKDIAINEEIKLCCGVIILNVQQQLYLKGRLKVIQKSGSDFFGKSFRILQPLARSMKKNLYKKH